jgi:hypothetical protein
MTNLFSRRLAVLEVKAWELICIGLDKAASAWAKFSIYINVAAFAVAYIAVFGLCAFCLVAVMELWPNQ